MIKNLLQLSNDLVIVADLVHATVELGHHFNNVLKRQGIEKDTIHAHIQSALAHLKRNNTLDISLQRFEIEASSFSILQRDEIKIVLIAKDKTHKIHRGSPVSSPHKSDIWSDEKDKRVHALLDESSDPIFSFKEDGTYLYVNNCFAHTLGYQPEDIIGKKIWDIFPQDEADKRFAMVKKVFQTGVTDNIEVKIPLPTGDVYFLTTVKPIKKADNRVEFIICISKNITELREAQDQLKILEGIIPICSSCKQIRDDEGAWQQMEVYISHHSEAEFSHGFCPDCAQKLYPDFIDKK